MRDVIVDHLVRESLIKDSQHGFIKNRSCTTNLLSFLEKITQEVDNGNPVDICYLDFSKGKMTCFMKNNKHRDEFKMGYV